MNEEEPLDLRLLGEVGEPELVRGALREFRRRWVRIAAIVLLAAAALASRAVVHRASRGLDERIKDRSFTVGHIYDLKETRVVLVDVADLDGGVGLHLIVTPGAGSQAQDSFVIDARQRLEFGLGDVSEGWFLAHADSHGRIAVRLERGEHCEGDTGGCPNGRVLGSFVIDLKALQLSEDLWRDQ